MIPNSYAVGIVVGVIVYPFVRYALDALGVWRWK